MFLTQTLIFLIMKQKKLPPSRRVPMNLLKDAFKSNGQNGATRWGGVSTHLRILPPFLLMVCFGSEVLLSRWNSQNAPCFRHLPRGFLYLNILRPFLWYLTFHLCFQNPIWVLFFHGGGGVFSGLQVRLVALGPPSMVVLSPKRNSGSLIGLDSAWTAGLP